MNLLNPLRISFIENLESVLGNENNFELTESAMISNIVYRKLECFNLCVFELIESIDYFKYLNWNARLFNISFLGK